MRTRRNGAKLSAKKCHPAQRSAVGDAPTSNRGVVSTENSRIEPVVGSLSKNGHRAPEIPGLLTTRHEAERVVPWQFGSEPGYN
jgi:hypothetical protein